jgi:hypothetical protein
MTKKSKMPTLTAKISAKDWPPRHSTPSLYPFQSSPNPSTRPERFQHPDLELALGGYSI